MQNIILCSFYGVMIVLNFRSFCRAKAQKNKLGKRLSVVGIFASFWCYMSFLLDIEKLLNVPYGFLACCICFCIMGVAIGALLYMAGRLFCFGEDEEDKE